MVTNELGSVIPIQNSELVFGSWNVVAIAAKNKFFSFDRVGFNKQPEYYACHMIRRGVTKNFRLSYGGTNAYLDFTRCLESADDTWDWPMLVFTKLQAMNLGSHHICFIAWIFLSSILDRKTFKIKSFPIKTRVIMCVPGMYGFQQKERCKNECLFWNLVILTICHLQ